MASSDTFELEVYDDELGRYVRVPAPSAKSLAVRKQSARATQKRRFEAKQAERLRANEAATANIDKLGSGIASIPSRVVNYIKSSTPSSVGRDVKGIAKATYEAATEDPNAFIEDAIFSPLAAIRDFGDVRETARKLRAQGRDAEAEKMEAMAGTAVLSAVPILGRPAGVATRKAIKAAENTAIKGAVRGAKETGTRDLSQAVFDPSIYGLRKKTEVPALKDFVVKTERRKPAPDGPVLGVEDIAGRPIMVGMSDRLGSGETITSVGNNALDIPVNEYGGQDFAYHNPYAWAVSTPQTATAMMNTAAALKKKYGVNPLWAPYRMGGTGTDFSKTTGELMMSQANSALGGGDRKSVDALIRQFIPDFKGIDNPIGYEQFGALGGDERKALQTALDNRFASEGALSLPITRALIAAPDQRAKPSFFLQNVMEIDPDKEVVFDPSANPTYGYNIPGNILGTLGPDINAAEVVGPMLGKKYADLGDLSVFRGQNTPLSVGEWRRQQKEYAAEKAAYDAKVAAGATPKKPPRKPVRMGNTSKFMQAGTFGFLDDEAAQAVADRLAKLSGK
jgi:hypothetical protein